MAASRWMFTSEQLLNTPSRKNGIDADKELSYRQQAANLIQDMGQRLQVEQLCINTAIVYMHRFYMFRSFTRFPRNDMAPACLFLAAKVEEQPRKLEHVIKVAHACLNRDHNTPTPDPKTEAYLEQAQQLVINENILLQTLGFEVTVDHPHTHVVKASTVILAKASKDLSKTSYYLATNSLHMTTFCLQYRPTVVACCCIYLACRWANYKIPRSNEGREWFQYVDPRVTPQIIEELYNEFLNILNKSPMKLRRKIMGWKASGSEGRDDERPTTSSQSDQVRSTSSHQKHSSSQDQRERQINHDRVDPNDVGKITHKDQKHLIEQRDGRSECRKDVRSEKHSTDQNRQGISSRPSDRKQLSQHIDSKIKREATAHSHGYKKESHSTDIRETTHPAESRREFTSQSKIDPNVNGRSAATNTSLTSARTSHDKTEENKYSETISSVNTTTTIPQQTLANSGTIDSGVKKSKTSIDFSEYIKRKEQERKESDRNEKLQKQREADILNRTFSESNLKEYKHRPPKLDISLPLPDMDHKSHTKDKSERPYSVNIKSPIKPHHNITVKSPIKSSDLKQPKLEIPKVQITPEKDGSDPCSVNINSDPAIRKLMENSKHDTGSFIDNSDELDSLPHTNDSNISVSIKQENSCDLEPGEILDPEIALKPEHSVAPDFKIHELGYDPDTSNSRLIKQESVTDSNTPGKTKLSIGNSPLKLKISTKGLGTDSDHSSGKHSSPHRHKHKHKDKHKSHKHSRDKDRHRHKDKDKQSSGTNGQSSLKMSIKLSDIPVVASGGEHWSVKHKSDKHKHRASISDPSLNKSNSLTEDERQQPWSMSDLMPVSGAAAMSPSRKRRRTPTVDASVEHTSSTKAAKTGSNRIRRSSSSHSVVSMELSDGEDGQINGPQIQTNQLNLLKSSLTQAIAQTKNNILKQTQVASVKRSHSNRGSPREAKPSIDRQQSGFDLEGMMWAGSGVADGPPLPPDDPPPPPPTHLQPPPPPTH
ncbi:Cyclin-T2 [Mactra antiquata]